MGEKFSKTLFILSANKLEMASHSVHYRRKTTSDFEYLLGFEVPNSILIISENKSYLMHNGLDTEQIKWDDDQLLPNLDEDIAIVNDKNFLNIISGITPKIDRIAIPIGRNDIIDRKILSIISYNRTHKHRSTSKPLSLCDSRQLLGFVRQKKDPFELQLLRKASELSSKVHRNLMEKVLIGKSELEISNWIESQMLKLGMQWSAYETIVGSGSRSTLLHARATEKIIQNYDMVVVDAGGEWNHYCADITRTLPSGKTFNKYQEQIYLAVLKAQKYAIDLVKPGENLLKIHEQTTECLKEELKTIFDLKDNEFNIKDFMPHPTSHWIGLDVHDPCPYFDDNGIPLSLEEGMCFTIEPGVYITPEHPLAPRLENYVGIGVRIEDDVVVTKQGSEILTSVPKELNDIYNARKL